MIFPSASSIRGLADDSALFVVEIADFSVRYDIRRKAALYASFGVRETLGDRRGRALDTRLPWARRRRLPRSARLRRVEAYRRRLRAGGFRAAAG